jgi:putative MFS transporter
VCLVFFWILLNVQFNGLTQILPFWFGESGKNNKYLYVIFTYTSEFVAMLTIYFMIDNERFGRKRSMQIFGTLIVILFAANYFNDNKIVVSAFFFLERYCMKSILILLCAYTSEIYPTHLRSIGISLTDMSSSIMTIVLPFAILFLYYWKNSSVIVLFFASALLMMIVSFGLWKDRTKRSLDLSKSMISINEIL